MKSHNNQCRAMRRDGTRCPNPAKFAGFCGVHFPKEKPAEKEILSGDKIGLAADLITIAAGAAALVEIIVKVWQELPFGRGPRMPADYEYLASKVSLVPTGRSDVMISFNTGPTTVDWAKARKLFDLSRSLSLRAETGSVSEEDARRSIDQIEEQSASLMDTLQEPFAKLLYHRIGRNNDSGLDS